MKNVVILGGGVAGCIFALKLSQLRNDVNIKIYEKSSKLASRILISGNGRCNIYNSHFINGFNDDKFYEIPKKEHTEEEMNEFDKMQDQMSAFTAVIDSLKWNLKPVQEAIKMNIKQLTESIQQVLEDTNALEEPIWQLEEYLGNQMDANGFDWKRENNIVYFTKDNKQIEYDAEAHPVPLITSKIDGKVVNQRQIISKFDIDKIIDDVVE